MTINIKQEYQDSLRELYSSPNHSIEAIGKIMGLSPHTVSVYAKKLGLSRPKVIPRNKLSKEHEKLIIENYEYGDFDKLSQMVGRSKHTITEWARRRGLVRMIEGKRNGNMEKLLDGSLESAYWHGILASDGYISKNGHLMFSQGEKDKDAVYEFAKFMNSSVYKYVAKSGYNQTPRNVYRVNIADKKIGKEIREMWGLKDGQQKTYTGMNLDFLNTYEKAICFFVGLFDGDGNSRADKTGKIEVHSNWLSTLNILNQKIGLEYSAKINKRGYAVVMFPKAFMKKVKCFIDQNNVPHNKRKWVF